MAGCALLLKAFVLQALRIVLYLTREEGTRLAAACQERNRLRDELLIHTLFQTGVRISGALEPNSPPDSHQPSPPIYGQPIRPIDHLTAEAWEDYRIFKAAGLLNE